MIALIQDLAALPGAYATLLTSHVLGISLLIGPIVILDLHRLGILKQPGIEVVSTTLEKCAAIGLALAILSGAFLVAVEPGTYLASPLFLTKLGFVFVGFINAASNWHRKSTSRANAALSILCWTSALVVGRTFAFV